jgi:YgiT-type zinc finger domain-containing protein
MHTENAKCPMCGNVGTLSRKVVTRMVSQDEQKYEIPGIEIIVCSACGEEMIEAKEMRKKEQILNDQSDPGPRGRGRPLGKEKVHVVNAMRLSDNEYERHKKIHEILKEKLFSKSATQTFLLCERALDNIIKNQGIEAALELIIKDMSYAEKNKLDKSVC